MPKELSRRRFLQTAAVATAATQLIPTLSAQPQPAHEIPYPENGTLIPDHGWHLWVDDKAAWMDDDIFLPEDVSWLDGKLCAKASHCRSTHPPAAGPRSRPRTGKEVLLPTTVEQHISGANMAAARTRPKSIATLRIPKALPRTTTSRRTAPITASLGGTAPSTSPPPCAASASSSTFRGAHLRAEVYLNQQLVGYSIMEELPFECDLTMRPIPAAKTISPSASPTPSAASTGSTASTPSGATSACIARMGLVGSIAA